MTSKKEHALALAARGFRVFPLAMNGKTPVNEGNWRKSATTDPARIAEMWSCPVMGDDIDYNIGIALAADIMVFDEDTRDGKQGDKSRAMLEMIYDDLPVTLVVRTASGGAHRYLSVDLPVANSASKVGQHLDIKSSGGFVVGPGSTIDGKAYAIEQDAPIAPAPDWLVQLAGAPRPRQEGQSTAAIVDLDSESAIVRATEWLERHAPEAGTYGVAAKVKDFGVSKEKCLDLVMEHWPPAESKGEDHIAFRVDNAYRYGQNAPGIASAEAEFEPVEIDSAKPSPPKRRGLYAVRWSEAKPTLDRPYLIDDVVDAGAMVVTYGDSNAGKTYVVLDQCFHIAAGKDWNGHKVQQGLVIYVAAEGGAGFFKRVEAFKRHYGVPDLPFSLVPCPIDLQSDNSDTRRLVKLIREEETFFSQKCVLVVVDTLARAMGGGDENTSVDMGKFVGHSDAIRATTGAAVNVIHHTGKDKAKGARGSSSLRAATDTEIEIRPGELEVMKQRDMAPSPALHFKLEAIEIGSRSDGRPVTACVVQWVSESEFETRVSPAALEVLGVLEELVAAEQDRIEEETGGDETNKSDIRIEWRLWQMSCLSVAKGPRGKKLNRTVLYRLRAELSQNGLVGKDSKNQWFIQ